MCLKRKCFKISKLLTFFFVLDTIANGEGQHTMVMQMKDKGGVLEREGNRETAANQTRTSNLQIYS